jgi:hypothetical protein
LDKGGRLDAIIIDFSKAFDLVPHDRLLTKTAASGVDSRVVTWVGEFLLGRTQRVRVGGKFPEEVRVMSGVPQGSVLGPLLFLAYANDISINTESTIRLFADDCIIYREILSNEDVEKLQTDLNRLGEWAVENVMIINPNRSKAVCFTRARVMEPLNYSLQDKLILEQSSCKYLGIILCRDLSWADQVNYTMKKAWKALHFTMCILKKGNLAHTSLMHPILEYGAAYWDPYRKGQINALDRVQNIAAKLAHHRNDSNWEILTQRRKIACICVLFKAYTGEWAWKTTGGRLQSPCYLSRVNHDRRAESIRQILEIFLCK